MQIPDSRFTRSLATELLDYMFTVPNHSSGEKAVWQTPQGREHRLSTLVDRRIGTGLFINWEPNRPGILRPGDDAQFTFDPRNKLEWPTGGNAWLTVRLFQHNLPRTDSAKVDRVVEIFKQLVKIANPGFAMVDWYAENMVKRKGKDPRRYAWGAMYYDAGHVKALGKQRLQSCAAIIKEEWPTGGMWIQTWANPFIVAKELTQTLEKELGLKQVFGDDEPKAIKKVAGRK